MIIKLTNTQNGKTAQFVSSWTLPHIQCEAFNKMTANDNINNVFEMDQMPRGFDSQVNPTSTIVNIFNSNTQILSSNAYYDRVLTVGFRNRGTITTTSSVAENLATLFTVNDKPMFVQIFDDNIENEYTCWCAVKEVPKNVFHDSFSLHMLSNTFSKIKRSREYTYNQVLDAQGNVVPDEKIALKFQSGIGLELGVNSYFTYNYNNIVDTRNSLRMSFNNNRSGRLLNIIFRDIEVIGNKFEIDMSSANIFGSEDVILDIKDKICIVNLVNDVSKNIVFPTLSQFRKYRLEFNYVNNAIANPIYSFETLDDAYTVPHIVNALDL